MQRVISTGYPSAEMPLNCGDAEGVEPPVRIELTTYALQERCSTAELRRRVLCEDLSDVIGLSRDIEIYSGPRLVGPAD